MPDEVNQIRLRLSRYLDGELEEAERLEVNRLVAENPQYAKALADMQAARAVIHDVGETAENLELWDNIAGQLSDDESFPVCAYDFEFISAYYDREGIADAERAQFEGQLYRNDDANRMLGELDGVTTALKNFFHRLEESCTVELTAEVMAHYQSNSGSPEEVLPEASEQAEMLSSYLDQALSSREMIEVNRRIEASEEYQQVLQRFSHLQLALHGYMDRLEQQAPDLWPSVSALLEKDVIPMEEARRKRQQVVRRIAGFGVPVAVAMMLLLVVSPGDLTPYATLESGAEEVQQEKSTSHRSELAALPVAANSTTLIRASYGQNRKSAPSATTAAPASVDYAMPVSSESMVSAGMTLRETRVYTNQEVPSSEEFLFEVMDARLVDTPPPVVSRYSSGT